jgi:hypothetical protein
VIPQIVFAQITQTAIITPSADATIVQGDSTSYGSSSDLISENNDDYKSFFIKFDLSAIPSNAIIEEATLSLNQISTGEGSVVISAYKVTSSWSESNISDDDKPSFDSGVTYGALSVDTSIGQKTFSQDFSDLVQNWVNDVSNNFGLYFEATTSALYLHEFGSRESSSKPTLSIIYTVPDEDSPTISDIQVQNISQSEATITWTTDEGATTYVEYGRTVGYGMLGGSGDEFITNHSVVLLSLDANTLYHFRVISSDASGNKTESQDQTFTTEADGEEEVEKSDEVADTITPPSNLKLSSRKEGSDYYVDVSWEYSAGKNVDEYRVYRSEEDSLSYSLLAKISGEENEYRDTSVEEGKTYFYVVRAVIDSEESADSNEEVITIFGSKIEEELHKLNFWKGLIILNIIILPIFGVWYFVFWRKRKRIGKKANSKRK